MLSLALKRCPASRIRARTRAETGASLSGIFVVSFMGRRILGKVLAAIQRDHLAGDGGVVDEVAHGAAEVGEIGGAAER